MRTRRVLVLAGITAVLAGIVYIPVAIGASAPSNPQDKNHRVEVIKSKAQAKADAQDALASPVCNFNGVRNTGTAAAVRTTSDPKYYETTAWTNLTCADLTIFIPRGHTSLVVATVNAELSCVGPVGTWCQGRVLIDNVDSYPMQASDSSPRAWAHAEADYSHYESNSMQASRIYTCPPSSPATSCTVRVTPQVSNYVDGMSFWVDDISTSVVATIL